MIPVQAVEMQMESFAFDLWVDWRCCERKDSWIGVVMVRQQAVYSDRRESKLLWVGTSQIVGTD